MKPIALLFLGVFLFVPVLKADSVPVVHEFQVSGATDPHGTVDGRAVTGRAGFLDDFNGNGDFVPVVGVPFASADSTELSWERLPNSSPASLGRYSPSPLLRLPRSYRSLLACLS
jgi:hypothetical protein